MIITSIDIGIQHLGLVKVLVSPKLHVDRVMAIDLVDIQEFHPFGNAETCPLKHHDKCFSDWIEHCCVNFCAYFADDVDSILIERQPPCGLVAVEQLLRNKYRDRVTLIHPKSVHNFFQCSDKNYEGRKITMEREALKLIKNTTHHKKFERMERRHDIADAICQMLCFLHKKRIQKHKEKMRKIRNENTQKILNRKMPNSEMTLRDFFKKCEFKNDKLS